ncbi:hypothetical protein MRX96_040239 [Rhipicephalus microplus]
MTSVQVAPVTGLSQRGESSAKFRPSGVRRALRMALLRGSVSHAAVADRGLAAAYHHRLSSSTGAEITAGNKGAHV